MFRVCLLWFHGVMVSTLDSESRDLSSNLSGTISSRKCMELWSCSYSCGHFFFQSKAKTYGQMQDIEDHVAKRTRRLTSDQKIEGSDPFLVKCQETMCNQF